ncbi:MAG TPA: 4Fe-4S binding protein [Geobacteraceae bacterium]
MGNRYIQPLRIAVQWGFLLFQLYLGICLYRFVLHFRSGGSTPLVSRPDGVEGFLPISALLSLRDWVTTGNINPIHPAGLVIFLAIVAVSLLLKRSFCSWVCPVGTVSEFFWKLGFKLFRCNLRPPRWLDVLLRGCKYLLLLFFLSATFWTMSPAAVRAFIQSDYNKMADIRLLDFFLHLSPGALLVIGVLVLLSFPIRNPFCRFLCPYGALLGLVSIFSPAKVTRQSSACVACGVCTQVCPSYIPIMARIRVFSPECIGCWRCISHCRAMGALDMRLTGRRIAVNGLLFALSVVLIVWGGSVIGKVTGLWHTAIALEEYARLIGSP